MSAFIKKWIVFFQAFLRVHHLAKKQHQIDFKEFSDHTSLSNQLGLSGISFPNEVQVIGCNSSSAAGAPFDNLIKRDDLKYTKGEPEEENDIKPVIAIAYPGPIWKFMEELFPQTTIKKRPI